MAGAISITQLDSLSAVRAVEATLRRIDRRLVDHGERVAYIACRMCQYGELPLDLKQLFFLSVFHDVGAYKTDEIDRMVEFETKDVWNHAIYGYLFLKYMSPMQESAEAILYHHTSWDDLQDIKSEYSDYASLIYLADRMDIVVSGELGENAMESLRQNDKKLFKPEYIDILCSYFDEMELARVFSEGSYNIYNASLCKIFSPSPLEALEYLKMIVFSIDFRSEHTVTHSINTISIAVYVARHFKVAENEVERLYLASLLHDVGKIAIPMEILEYKGRLDDDRMRIMRTHVDETEKLIRGVVPDDICEIAIRHHEKLDGSGYPQGLSAEFLTFSQRIIAVADIVSALNSQRSYKEPYPKEKAVAILMDMSQKQLDPEICRFVCDNYDEVISNTENERKDVIETYQKIMTEFERLKSSSLFAVHQ